MSFNIEVQPTQASKLSTLDFDNIPFGRVFSDHMFVGEYYDGAWQKLTIQPFKHLSISPANMTLHYSQTIFEGLKAFKNEAGTPTFFRLNKHAKRMNISAKRLAMPEIPEELFQQAVMELVQLDKHWIPNTPDSSLYVRPFMFAADEFIGVKASSSYKFIIFTCPVGKYYGGAVKVITADKYVRAIQGGVGFAKTGGNYAASLLPMVEARANGYDQVMWMDGVDFKYIQECGTMNLFFVIDGTLITPPTSGAILDGITRDSFIQMAKHAGHNVEERPITIEEVVEAYHAGTLEEAFGSGTAAVVAPISHIKHGDLVMELPPVEDFKVGSFLKSELKAIRTGVKDPFNWVETLPVLVNAAT